MSAIGWNTSPVWTAAGWTMLHVVWVGAAIGFTAALMRRLLNSARPEARYGVALVCLLALSISPALIFVQVFAADSGPGFAKMHSQAAKLASRASFAGSVHQPITREFMRDATPFRPVSARVRWRLEALVPLLPWFWLCGAAVTQVMLATGLVGVERLQRSSRLVESGDVARRCRALADSIGIARCVSVGICDRLAMPVLIGIVRPLILLPPAALGGWSVEQLEMVLLHELAHLRRWDNLLNLLQRFAESLLFFHPTVWWLSGWVRLERELCCDRLVIERVGHPVAYAEMLVALSGSNHRGRQAVVAMADRHVLTRIRRLLNLEERSMKLTMPEGFGLLGAGVLGVLVVLGSQAAQDKPVDIWDRTYQKVATAVGEDIKKTVAKDAIPASEKLKSGDTNRTNRPEKPAPPKSLRSVSLTQRDERRLEIVEWPPTPEGVTRYRIRGGVKIICKWPKSGTILLEAEEAVIKCTQPRIHGEPWVGPHGETWFEEDEVPMEMHLQGDVIFRNNQDKPADEDTHWTLRASQLDFDCVTGHLWASDVKIESGFMTITTVDANISSIFDKHDKNEDMAETSPKPIGTSSASTKKRHLRNLDP